MSERKRKPRGMRNDKRVQVTCSDGRKADGSLNRISFYGATRAEAEAKRDAYLAARRMGIVRNEMTVSEWIDVCLELYRPNVNEAYLNNDAIPYERLRKRIGSMRVADVREADLQSAMNEMAGMSTSSIKKYYHAMFQVFERARKNHLIADNPAENVTLQPGTKGSHRALERWEIDCILNHWNEHRAGIWAMLMMLAGLRRGEMMALRWENVDMVARTLTVCEVAVIRTNQAAIEQRAKTVAGVRTIPICDPLFAALNTIEPSQRQGFVCRRQNGEQLSESAFERGWDGFCLAMQRILNGEDVVQQGRRVKLEDKIAAAEAQGHEYILFRIRAHDLRHTFATALYDAGVPLKAAQYYLGHADIRMTLDLYTHLSQETEKSSRIQLVGFLDKWLSNDSMDGVKLE